MALIDQAALAADATFRNQVRMAALGYAVTAIVKTKTANTRADEKVYSLAVKVLGDGCTSDVDRFAYGLAAAPNFPFVIATPPTATDANIKTAIATAWPFFAGVTSLDVG